MTTDKVISADNQQERLKLMGWIVGFTDGEGCFTVSLHRNSTTSLGWQIMPEFILSQGKKSLNSLLLVKNYFKCGRISVNHRHDNHREDLYRYCVKSQKELNEKIIPFFEENKLKTSKSEDFNKFSSVLRLMKKKEHLTSNGVNNILGIISTMNTKKIRLLNLESSETTRRIPVESGMI